jgi:hypothetical protein
MAGLGLALALGGCNSLPVPIPHIGCTVCSVAHDATYTKDSPDGLLIYGLTVTGTAAPAVAGRASWRLEPADSAFPSRHLVDFPEEMVPGRHYVVVRRVPAGIWSLIAIGWHRDDAAGGRTPAMAGEALAIRVAPGRISYAGDLTVSVSGGQTRLAVTGGGTEARAALAAYPGLTAPLVVAPLHDLRGKPGKKAGGL